MDSIYKTDHETLGSAVQKVYDGLSNLERKVLLRSLTSFTNGKPEVKNINDYFEKLFKNQ